MPLTKDDLVSKLTSISPINPTVQVFAQQLAAKYLVYAQFCQTGMPMSVAPTGVNIALLDPTKISTPLSALTTSSTEDDFAEALSNGIKLFWTGVMFNVPANITGSVMLPPVELLAKLPKNSAIEAASNSISAYVDKIVTDLESIPNVLAGAAVGASASALSQANLSLSTNIASATSIISTIKGGIASIPVKVTNTSNFSSIGSAFSDIGSGCTNLVSAVSSIVTTITGLPTILGASAGAAAVKALTPVTDDVSTQCSNISESATKGIANLTAPSAQKVQLKAALLKAFLNEQTDAPDGFKIKMEKLALILHGCTRTGTTAGVNATNPLTPINFIGILGDPSDTDPIDLT